MVSLVLRFNMEGEIRLDQVLASVLEVLELTGGRPPTSRSRPATVKGKLRLLKVISMLSLL